MSSPRHHSIHDFPNQPCPQGYYHWNNGFSSGCKPISEDRRRLALQFHRGAIARQQLEQAVGRVRGAVGRFGEEVGHLGPED
jgi:hypothetical protein